MRATFAVAAPGAVLAIPACLVPADPGVVVDAGAEADGPQGWICEPDSRCPR